MSDAKAESSDIGVLPPREASTHRKGANDTPIACGKNTVRLGLCLCEKFSSLYVAPVHRFEHLSSNVRPQVIALRSCCQALVISHLRGCDRDV